MQLLRPILKLMVRNLGPGKLRLTLLKIGHGIDAF
jgi:hypothetical protein